MERRSEYAGTVNDACYEDAMLFREFVRVVNVLTPHQPHSTDRLADARVRAVPENNAQPATSIKDFKDFKDFKNLREQENNFYTASPPSGRAFRDSYREDCERMKEQAYARAHEQAYESAYGRAYSSEHPQENRYAPRVSHCPGRKAQPYWPQQSCTAEAAEMTYRFASPAVSVTSRPPPHGPAGYAPRHPPFSSPASSPKPCEYTACDMEHQDGPCELHSPAAQARRATVGCAYADHPAYYSFRPAHSPGTPAMQEALARGRLYSYDEAALRPKGRDASPPRTGQVFACAYCDAKYVYRRCLVNHLMKTHKRTVERD